MIHRGVLILFVLLVYLFFCQMAWLWNVAHYCWWFGAPSYLEFGAIVVVSGAFWDILIRVSKFSFGVLYLVVVLALCVEVSLFGVGAVVDTKGILSYPFDLSKWAALGLFPISLAWSFWRDYRRYERKDVVAILIVVWIAFVAYCFRSSIDFGYRRIAAMLVFSLLLGPLYSLMLNAVNLSLNAILCRLGLNKKAG